MLPAVKYAVILVSGICDGGDGDRDNSFLVCCPCEKVTFIKQGQNHSGERFRWQVKKRCAFITIILFLAIAAITFHKAEVK